MNWSLDLGMIINQRLPATTRQFIFLSPQILISRILIILK
jgi:hypothetical protein